MADKHWQDRRYQAGAKSVADRLRDALAGTDGEADRKHQLFDPDKLPKSEHDFARQHPDLFGFENQDELNSYLDRHPDKKREV